MTAAAALARGKHTHEGRQVQKYRGKEDLRKNKNGGSARPTVQVMGQSMDAVRRNQELGGQVHLSKNRCLAEWDHTAEQEKYDAPPNWSTGFGLASE